MVRTEEKEIPVYAMTIAKGGYKLHRAAGSGAATLRPVDGEMVFERTTLSEFADRLARRPLKVDRPVLDETGLSGAWDFRLRFANSIDELKGAMESMDRGDPNAPLLSSVIRSQLGLRLEARKGPVDVLVVEHANRVPTGN
jgi:uncharacterized protein (TIGR03435 family)